MSLLIKDASKEPNTSIRAPDGKVNQVYQNQYAKYDYSLRNQFVHLEHFYHLPSNQEYFFNFLLTSINLTAFIKHLRLIQLSGYFAVNHTIWTRSSCINLKILKVNQQLV